MFWCLTEHSKHKGITAFFELIAFMNDNQKWINLSYLLASSLIALVVFLLANKFSVFLDFEGRVRSLDLIIKGGSMGIGALVFVGLYRSAIANHFMNEVVVEFGKVTWPTQDETLKATALVIVAVVIAGIILWIFDTIWVSVLGLIL